MKTKVLFTISVFCMLCIAALAQDKQALAPTGNTLGSQYRCEPIHEVGFSFNGRIAVSDGAEGYIMCADEEVARGVIRVVSPATDGVSWAYISFEGTDDGLLLPKGKDYRAVIPAGALWLESDPGVKNEEIVASFSVPQYLPVKEIIYQNPFEGQSYVPIVFSAKVKVSDSSKAYLYRNGLLVRVMDVMTDAVSGTSYEQTVWVLIDGMTESIKLFEKDANYSIVLPGGSICASGREDIMNDDISFDFIGAGHSKMLRHKRCSLDGVAGLSEIGEVSLYYETGLFLTPGAKLQLYDGATLIAEAEASLAGDPNEDAYAWQSVLTADFGGISTAGHESLTIVVPEATVAQDDGDVVVNEREETSIDIAAGISGVEADGGVKVACSGGVLTVSNARQGACITVCSVDGKAVSRCTAGGASVDIPLSGDGVYIVNVDGKTYKLASQTMKN